MNHISLLQWAFPLALLVFVLPKKLKTIFSTLISVYIVGCSFLPIMEVLLYDEVFMATFSFRFWNGEYPAFYIDQLSAFFMLTINVIIVIGSVYAIGYLRYYLPKKSGIEFSLHLFSFNLLHLSLLFVCMAREGFTFLLMWEMMSLSSFFLILWKHEQAGTIKAALKYLIYMHIGYLFLVVGFLWLQHSGLLMSFDSLKDYFLKNSNIPLFAIFFVGFATKAGLVPFHIWLPHTYGNAPSHVSAIMAGAVTKMGIYGILRVSISLHSDILEIGAFIFGLGLHSAIFGIVYAIFQTDLKKKLAYSSIEGIGIICTGVGIGLMGIGLESDILTLFGFTGALLHLFNHSIFKSLLFMGAGSVYQVMETHNIEQMGGIAKKLPQTSALFLIGSLAVCSLPPFNGFISEFLLYDGLLNSLKDTNIYRGAALIFGVIILALAGGLAIFCYTKLYGVAFLGTARTSRLENATESNWLMLVPQYILVTIIIVIGLFPNVVVEPVFNIVSNSIGKDFHLQNQFNYQSLYGILKSITLTTSIFIGFIVILLIYKYLQQKNKAIEYSVTWGCGFTGGTPKMQYTATSFADNLFELARPALMQKTNFSALAEGDIFPKNITFERKIEDLIEEKVYEKLGLRIVKTLKKTTILQTGSIQHYLMYAFMFLIIMLLLTFLNVI